MTHDPIAIYRKPSSSALIIKRKEPNCFGGPDQSSTRSVKHSIVWSCTAILWPIILSFTNFLSQSVCRHVRITHRGLKLSGWNRSTKAKVTTSTHQSDVSQALLTVDLTQGTHTKAIILLILSSNDINTISLLVLLLNASKLVEILM